MDESDISTSEYIENKYYKPVHDTCKKIANDAYKDFNPYQSFDGYKRFYDTEIDKTGFYGCAYINAEKKSVIIAFRGTEKSIADIKTDIALGIKNHIPAQFYDAEKFYKDIQKKLGKKLNEYEIIFSGHSMGGSIAQLMGAKYGNETITFNAFGVGNINNLQIKYTENIINYGNTEDFVYLARGSMHIGKTIPIVANEQILSDSDFCITKYHSIPYMGDIKKVLNKVK